MKYFHYIICSSIFYVFTLHSVQAQEEFNYEESNVPAYVLPDPFVNLKGDWIQTKTEWEFQRRPEIVSLFEEHVYGRVPKDFDQIKYETVSEDKTAVGGIAHLKEVDVTISRNGNSLTIRMNLFIPNERKGPAPVFLLINHRGQEDMDPGREIKKDFWSVERILARGYATGTFDVGDVSDDNKESFQEDVLEKLYPEHLQKDDGMRGLSAWAWGAMRIMDYFEKDPDIDEKRAAVVGHSRSGKAALWTGAQDPRWAITISNESGCGGAALSRRRFGETVSRINTNFPYWFNTNFKNFNDNEDALPIDQHLLIACMAPRAVYVASAAEDLWADPRGEYLSLKHASRVYKEIYQMAIDLPQDLPAVNQPIQQPYVGHHIREGKHDLSSYDWERFMDFADLHFNIDR